MIGHGHGSNAEEEADEEGERERTLHCFVCKVQRGSCAYFLGEANLWEQSALEQK